jgi:MFS family permease
MSKLGPDRIVSDYLSGWRLHVVIACLFWGSFVMALDTNIINVALPVITAEFHDLEGYARYGSAYLLTLTAFQPIYGSLFKYFQTDIVYRAAIFSFEGRHLGCISPLSVRSLIVDARI